MVAGRPDRPGSTGLSPGQIWRGVTGTGFGAGATLLAGRNASWAYLTQQLQLGGAASVSLLSSALPVSYRFRYQGRHQVGVTWSNGQWYIANPLAPSGVGPMAISEAALKRAIFAFSGGNKVAGVLFSRIEATETTETIPVPWIVSSLTAQPDSAPHTVDAFASASFYRARRHRRV